MKLSFETVKDLKQKTEQFVDKFPLVTDPSISREDIVDMGLHQLHGKYKLFTEKITQEQLDYVLGEKTITFDELKEKMIDVAYNQYTGGKKIAKKDWFNPTDEVEKLKKVYKKIKKLTKKEFESHFKNSDKYDELFLSLYRLELDLNQYLYAEIFNYLVNNNVEVFDSILNSSYEFEELLSDFDFDEGKVSKLIEIKENTTELFNILMREVDKFDKDFDRKSLKKKLNLITK